MKIDGRCHCGYIAYEAEANPAKALICHCTDCQTLSGSAFRTVLPTREGSFKLRSGELKIYVKTGESGSFVWALFVNATNLPQNCKYGLVQPSTGSTISAR
jgi:hypothetical protein